MVLILFGNVERPLDFIGDDLADGLDVENFLQGEVALLQIHVEKLGDGLFQVHAGGAKLDQTEVGKVQIKLAAVLVDARAVVIDRREEQGVHAVVHREFQLELRLGEILKVQVEVEDDVKPPAVGNVAVDVEGAGFQADDFFDQSVEEFKHLVGAISFVHAAVDVKHQPTGDLEVQDVDLHDVAVGGKRLVRIVIGVGVAPISLGRILVAGLNVVFRRLVRVGHDDDRGRACGGCPCVPGQGFAAADVGFGILDLQGDAHPLRVARRGAELVALFLLAEVSVGVQGPTRQRGGVVAVVVNFRGEALRIGFEDGNELRGKLHFEHFHQHHKEREVQAHARSGVAKREHELGDVVVIRVLLFRALVDGVDIIRKNVGESLLVVEVGAEEEPQRVLQTLGILFRRGGAFARAVTEVAPNFDIHRVCQEVGEVKPGDLKTGETKDRQRHVSDVFAVEIVKADGQGHVTGVLVDLRDLKQKFRLLAVFQVQEHFHMDAQAEVGMRVAVVYDKHGGIVLAQAEHIAQDAVQADGQDVVAARKREVDGRCEMDLHILNERIGKVIRHVGFKVVRALEGSVLRRVGLNRRLRLKSGQRHRNVVLALFLTCQFDEGLRHAVHRRGFELRSEVGKVLIAQIRLVAQHQQQIVVHVGIEYDHAHLIADLHGG